MPAAWEAIFPSRKTASASKAKERLQLVLINDRTDLNPDTIEKMKNELLAVISHYIEIDPDTVSISMTQTGREQRLTADIPIKPNRRQRIG